MFWGTIVQPSSSPSLPVVIMPKASLLVTNCALGLGGNEHRGERVTVHCIVSEEGNKEKDVVVCALCCGIKEHAKMDLVIEAGIPLRFYIEGPVEVHLTGYYIKSFLEPQEEEEEEEEKEGEKEEKDSEDEDVDISVFYREEYRDPLGFGEVADENDEKNGDVETYNEDVEKTAVKKKLDFESAPSAAEKSAEVEKVEEDKEGDKKKNNNNNNKNKNKKNRKRKNKKEAKGTEAGEPPAKKSKKNQKKKQKKQQQQQQQQPQAAVIAAPKTSRKVFYAANGMLAGVEACGDLGLPKKVGGDLVVQDHIIGAGPKASAKSRVTLTYTVQQKGGEQERAEKRVFVFGEDAFGDKDLYRGICGMHAGGRRTITKGEGEKVYDVTLTMVNKY